MTKCFRISGTNCSGGTFDVYDGSWESIGTAPGGCGVFFVLNGVQRGDLGSNQSVMVTQVDCSFCSVSGCENPSTPSTPYDCLNGACITKSTYSTPGLYPSLEECQVACGTGCSGVCLSNSDWGTIKGLASQLKNQNCSGG